MAESINDIAIKLSVDAAGVSRGFRTAAEEARVFKAEVDRLSYAVGKNEPQQYDAHVRNMQEQRTAAIKEQNEAQEEANRIIRQHMTLNDRYAQQLATLTRLNNTILVATGKQALSDEQMSRAKTALTLSTIRQQQAQIGVTASIRQMNGGFGGTSMAIGQASYAAEDFIQVLSMGGGLNMALMSASNNLSMVVRSLMGTSAAMSAVAGLALPAVLIGTNLLIQNMMKEEEQVDLVTEAYKRLNAEREHTNAMADIQSQHAANMADIQAITTHAQAVTKLAAETKALADAEKEEAKAQQNLIDKRKDLRDTIAGGSVIAEAQRVLDAMRLSPDVFDWMDIATAEDDVRHLTEAYKDLAETIQTGTPQAIQTAAEEFQNAIKNTKEIGKVFTDFSSKFDKQLSPILGSKEELALLGEAGNAMKELAKAAKIAEDHVKSKAEAQQKHNELLEKEKQIRQENMLFQLRATEVQKAEMDIRKQLVDFLGLTDTQPGQLDLTSLMGKSNQEAMDFLKAYNANLERAKQDTLNEQRQVSPTGGMEQSAFKAQAEALQQMLEAQYKKEDPQLKDIDTHIQQGNQLLQQLTDGQGLIRVP